MIDLKVKIDMDIGFTIIEKYRIKSISINVSIGSMEVIKLKNEKLNV